MIEKEVPDDLTMLKPEPTADQQAFQELMSNPPKGEAAIAAPTSRNEATQYVQGLQEDYLQGMSMKDGSRDPDLDGNQSMFEDQNSVRSRNQSEGIKGIKAVGGGILQGALIAAEQLGYVGDLEGVYQRFMGDPEGVSGNWWSDLMSESQDAIRESDTFKIYEDAPDPNSITSQIFKWSSLEGAISSAVGFGISGLGAAKLVSTLGSLGKFKELAKFTDIAMGNLKGGAALAEATAAGGGVAGATGAFVGPLATSAMSNYFMGQMMATDTYNHIMESLEPMIGVDGFTRLDAQKTAAKEAQDVVGLNMALTATAYIKFGGIFKRTNKIKGLVENPTALNQIKNLIKAGSPTAFTENVYQEMIQMEQIHDAQKTVGQESEYSENYWDRMTQLALSNRALHAGALGVVGGPVQFALIQRPMMGKQIKSQKELFDRQKASQTWQKELVKNYYDTFNKYDTASKEALIKGNPKEAMFIDDIHTIEELSKSIENGTLGVLKKDIQDSMKMKPEEAQEQYKYAGDYKEAGQQFLSTIEKAESFLAHVSGRDNKTEIVQTMLMHDRTREAVRDIQKTRLTHLAEVADGIKLDLNKEVHITPEGKLVLPRAENRFEGKSVSDKSVILNKEKAEDASLKDYLAKNPEYQAYTKANNSLKKYEKFRDELWDLYEAQNSDKGEAAYNKSNEEGIAEHETRIKEKVAEAETTENNAVKAKEKSKFDTFEQTKENAPELTTEELKELHTDWDNTSKGNKVKATKTSFTARDENGQLRIYTPGQLLRSNDGRHFKVLHQVGATGKEKGKIKKLNRPVVQETTPEGKIIKGRKPTVIDDHSFLRDENLMPRTNKDGQTFTPKDGVWGTYVKTDSILKPNDAESQLRLVDRAAKGEVASVNIPANAILNGDFEWLGKFNHQLLNQPFKEPYDVVYKVDNQGEYEVYVDVYKRVEGKEDLLLTRVSRDSNLNYQALVNLIVSNKSEVTGKVVAHYSNRWNLVKHYDNKGEKIYSDLKDIRAMKDHLINGQIILAQSTGEGSNPYITVARGEDGTVYADGHIMVNGEPKAIPYGDKIITPGDTYALILSPGGEIVPLALSARSLKDIPSNIGGNNMIDDVVASWKDAVNTWLADEIADQPKIDAKIQAEVDNNINTADSQKAWLFKVKKEQVIFDKLKEQKGSKAGNTMQAIFKDTIFKTIRPNWDKYTRLRVDENGDPEYDSKKSTRGKTKLFVRSRLFNPTIKVSESTGEFTPAVEVRDPNNHTAIATYNLIDNPTEFYEVLGNQRMRASIEVLSNDEIKGPESKKMMKEFIENQGFQIDIDTNNPFIGSSATLTVDGSEFLEGSKKAAIYKEKYLQESFGKALGNIEAYSAEAQALAVEEFVVDLEASIDNDWLHMVDASTESVEITDRFKEVITSFNLVEQHKALKMLSDYMVKVPEDLQGKFEEKKEELFDAGVINNTDLVTTGMLVLNTIQNQVESGTLHIKSKNRLKTKDDPTGKFTQPEGYTFESGSRVYHSERGEALFQTTLKDGKYRIVLQNKAKTVIDAFPGDVVSANRDRAELFRTLKSMGNIQDTSSDEYKALDRKKKRLDTKIVSSIVSKIGDKNDPETTGTGEVDKTNILLDRFTGITTSENTLKKLEGFGSTDRTREIAEHLAVWDSIEASAKAQGEAGEVSTEFLVETNKAVLNMIPYSKGSLDALIALATEKKDLRAIADLTNLKRMITAGESYNPEAGISVTMSKFSSKKGEIVKATPAEYLAPGVSFAVTGEVTLTELSQVVSAVAKGIASEARLRESMFVVKDVPTPQATSAVKTPVKPLPKPVSTTPIDLNGAQQAETLESRLEDLEAPSDVLELVESGQYSEPALNEVLKLVEDFRDSGMPAEEINKIITNLK